MKRTAAILLVIILAFSWIACSNNSAKTSPSAETPSAETSPSALQGEPANTSLSPSADSSPGKESTIGFLTDDVDPFSREPYKFATLSVNTDTAFNQSINLSFTAWGTVLNFSVFHFDACMNYDTYITEIQLLHDQGYDGLYMMMEDSIRGRCYELTQELSMPCVGILTAFSDDDGHVIWPSVCQDEYGNGAQCTQWLADNYENYWKEPLDKTTLGMIVIDFSPISGIHSRVPGVQDTFIKVFPEAADNFFIADLVTQPKGFNNESAFEITAGTIAAHPEITNWFIVACVDDWAIAAERAVESLNKNDNVLIVSNQVDAFGIEIESGNTVSSYVAACAVSPAEITSYCVTNLCAILDGRATPETIWPEYVTAGNEYPCIYLMGTMVTRDTYAGWLESTSFETLSAGMKQG